MVSAVVGGHRTTLGGDGFAVRPPGVDDDAPFSFIVIGDTGEGDASQHVLRDQLIRASEQPDVRFVVISSDVVYPTGAMKDYEARFWLPFKGVTRPIYAIPGNHDWYDALEGFAATFLDPASARLAMRARIEEDNRLTGTTEATIEHLIGEAARLRHEYGVPTGFQDGPFFQVQTARFALIAVDTGVLKQVDAHQLAWLRAALDRARGKAVFALLGHPLYAGGLDQTIDNPPFAAIRRLLDEHGVRVVMAGDTHDFEYYRESRRLDGRTVHHFVNGGGGAYLSFGTALAWPTTPPTPAWAFYPTRTDVVGKIDRWTPFYKRPAWWWTRRVGAWPFSAEWLSAAFDYNVAPFFQSFVEVRVEPAEGRIRLRPWGVHGRLTWADLQASPSLPPPGAAPGDVAEWAVDARTP
jgi:3',5'-cyclic AMP phosphodiesterase CpdA